MSNHEKPRKPTTFFAISVRKIKKKPQKIQQREHGEGVEETLAHSLEEEKEKKEIEEQEHFLLKVSHKIKV